MNLFLCGMPGTGKTYYGKLLAEHLNCSFLDTDQMIEVYVKQSCRQYVRTYGMEAFRQLEKHLLETLVFRQKTVVATGGGVVIDLENIDLMRAKGKSIYLKNDLAVLYERLKLKAEWPSYIDPKRPELSFFELMGKRALLYENCDITLDISRLNDDEVLRKIMILAS